MKLFQSKSFDSDYRSAVWLNAGPTFQVQLDSSMDYPLDYLSLSANQWRLEFRKVGKDHGGCLMSIVKIFRLMKKNWITFFEICDSGDRGINGPLLIILSQWFIHLTFDLWCTFWSCLKTFFRPVPFYISVKVRPNRKNDL